MCMQSVTITLVSNVWWTEIHPTNWVWNGQKWGCSGSVLKGIQLVGFIGEIMS